MKRAPMLVGIVVLPVIFSVVGCGGGASQQGAEQERTHHQTGAVKLDLRPEGDSGVSGTASFEDRSGGVLVKLDLRNLPKPNTLYLAHIHPGTCAEEEKEGGEDHEHMGHKHSEEIEYPLSQVKSDSEGHGSSTTTLRETSVDKLFSGGPKHVNVHEAGSGNPPVLTCADLKRAG
jgi:hypothetical protein